MSDENVKTDEEVSHLRSLMMEQGFSNERIASAYRRDVDVLVAVIRRLLEKAEAANSTPYFYDDHIYCKVCRECITCNLRPCRDGGEHKA